MSDQMTAGSVFLHDGRRLTYLSVGPEDGMLVLYLHGAIGSPQDARAELQDVTRDLRIRYVMVSRPGFDGSDPAPGRTLLSFARDAAALADHLGHERFTVVGVSAGGPYALACAHELPARVAAAAVVGCMAPGGYAAAELPPPARVALRLLRARPRACTQAGDALLAIARRYPQIVVHAMRAGAAPAGRRVLAESGSEVDPQAAARFLATARGGIGAMVDDHLLCAQPWGFRPADIRVPVHVWHGMHDAVVPIDDAMHLVAELPRVQAAVHPDEGHFFYRRRLREILGDLVACGRSARQRAGECAER